MVDASEREGGWKRDKPEKPGQLSFDFASPVDRVASLLAEAIAICALAEGGALSEEVAERCRHVLSELFSLGYHDVGRLDRHGVEWLWRQRLSSLKGKAVSDGAPNPPTGTWRP